MSERINPNITTNPVIEFISSNRLTAESIDTTAVIQSQATINNTEGVYSRNLTDLPPSQLRLAQANTTDNKSLENTINNIYQQTPDEITGELESAIAGKTAKEQAEFWDKFLTNDPTSAMRALSVAGSRGNSTISQSLSTAYNYRESQQKGGGYAFANKIANVVGSTIQNQFQRGLNIGNLVAGGNDKLRGDFARAALVNAHQRREDKSNPVRQQSATGLTSAAFNAVAGNKNLLVNTLKHTTEGDIKNLLASSSPALAKALNTAAAGRFGVDFFLSVSRNLDGNTSSEIKQAAFNYFNQNAVGVADRMSPGTQQTKDFANFLQNVVFTGNNQENVKSFFGEKGAFNRVLANTFNRLGDQKTLDGFSQGTRMGGFLESIKNAINGSNANEDAKAGWLNSGLASLGGLGGLLSIGGPAGTIIGSIVGGLGAKAAENSFKGKLSFDDFRDNIRFVLNNAPQKINEKLQDKTLTPAQRSHLQNVLKDLKEFSTQTQLTL